MAFSTLMSVYPRLDPMVHRPSLVLPFDHLLASQSSEDQIFGRGCACVPNFPEVAVICSREEEAAMKARGLAICHIADGNCLFRAQPKRLERLAHWRSRTARLEHHPIWCHLPIPYAFVPTSHQTQKIRSKHENSLTEPWLCLVTMLVW